MCLALLVMPQRSPRGHQTLLGATRGISNYQTLKNWDLRNTKSCRYICEICKFSKYFQILCFKWDIFKKSNISWIMMTFWSRVLLLPSVSIFVFTIKLISRHGSLTRRWSIYLFQEGGLVGDFAVAELVGTWWRAVFTLCLIWTPPSEGHGLEQVVHLAL